MFGISIDKSKGLLFCTNDLHGILRNRAEELRREVDVLDANRLLNTAPDDLKNYLVTKYQIEPINLLRDQEYGRLIMVGSTSGLLGNIGQANYAAAKMGIVGLSRIIAMEGAAKGVRSNVIAPFAWTRMIASIPVKDAAAAERVERIRNTMRTDQVAAFAVALCADKAKDTSGQIFAVRGNEIFLFSQPRPVRGLADVGGWTPESLLERALPALKADMEDLGASASVFSWDPI